MLHHRPSMTSDKHNGTYKSTVQFIKLRNLYLLYFCQIIKDEGKFLYLYQFHFVHQFMYVENFIFSVDEVKMLFDTSQK